MKNKKISIIMVCIALAGGVWYVSTRTSQRVLDTSADRAQEEVVDADLPQDTLMYFTHPLKNFSFAYDSTYTLSRFEDSLGETILLQKNNSGIQIYSSEFTAGGVLSASRIKKEIGSTVRYAQDIEMPAGFKAVTFSTTSAGGEVWDVWFVKDKILYQITAEPGHDTLLKQIVENWNFE